MKPVLVLDPKEEFTPRCLYYPLGCRRAALLEQR